MFGVEIVRSTILPDTGHIMGHNMELGKVEMACFRYLVNRAKSLEGNLGFVNPI